MINDSIKSKCNKCDHCKTFNELTYYCDIAIDYIGRFENEHTGDCMLSVTYHIIDSYTDENPKWCPCKSDV